MIEKKITKKEMYEAIKVGCTTGEWTVSDVEVAEFCMKEIEALDRKAAKAKERAAEKKAEADALIELVAEALTDEFSIVADITARIDHEDATVSKVVYRLNKLASAGLAEKSEVSVGGGEGAKARKLVAFRTVQAND